MYKQNKILKTRHSKNALFKKTDSTKAEKNRLENRVDHPNA